MSTLKLKGSTSGYVELTAPATAGDNTITLPTTAGSVVVADGSGNVNVSGIITATSLNTTGDVTVGSGVTIYASSGIVSATTFYGDASGLSNVPAGSSLTGDFTITNGNVVVSSGYGIDFSATSGTGTSELLDDYEEGTFTPTINTGYTVSYDTQSGRYVKIGKQVAVWICIDTNTISGSSSDTYAEVEGLPFTIRNALFIETAFTVGWEYNLSNSVDHAYGNGNTTYVVLLGPNSSGSRTHWTPVQVWNNNDARICLTGVYWTDS